MRKCLIIVLTEEWQHRRHAERDLESADLREVAAMATYGWGVIPVVARIGDVESETSLFPKDGGYLLPLRDAVRKPQKITVGDAITIKMTVRLQR